MCPAATRSPVNLGAENSLPLLSRAIPTLLESSYPTGASWVRIDAMECEMFLLQVVAQYNQRCGMWPHRRLWELLSKLDNFHIFCSTFFHTRLVRLRQEKESECQTKAQRFLSWEIQLTKMSVLLWFFFEFIITNSSLDHENISRKFRFDLCT